MQQNQLPLDPFWWHLRWQVPPHRTPPHHCFVFREAKCETNDRAKLCATADTRHHNRAALVWSLPPNECCWQPCSVHGATLSALRLTVLAVLHGMGGSGCTHSTIMAQFFEALAARDVDPSPAWKQAIDAAAQAGHWDVVWSRLTQLPYCKDPRVWSGLLAAAVRHGVTTVQRVCELAHKRDVHLRMFETVCQVAMQQGSFSMLRVVVEYAHHSGACSVRAILSTAAQLNYMQVVRSVLSVPIADHAELIVAFAHDVLSKVVTEFSSQVWQPALCIPYLRTLRLLVMECPGGDTWMDDTWMDRTASGAYYCDKHSISTLATLARSSLAPTVPSILFRHAQRRRVWHRRGTLLALRALRGAGRAIARSHMHQWLQFPSSGMQEASRNQASTWRKRPRQLHA